LTVTLPSAKRARAARARQIGWLNVEQGQQPPITVIRAKGTVTVKHDAAVDFVLQPGDVVQVGSLFPSALELSSDVVGVSGNAEGPIPSQPGEAVAPRDAAATIALPR